MQRLSVLGLVALSSVAAAQTAVKSHPLGAVTATSKELLGSVSLARHLPNGSVIVNDQVKRRVLMLDPTLQNYTVIADSSAGATNSYGQRAGALIPYVADSTLYLDVTAGSFLVIDPAGKVTRVMSTPRPNDNALLSATALGYPGFDAKGRLVYRSNFQPTLQQFRDGSIQAAPRPDTAPVLRVDLDTRRADTIAAVKLPRMISSSITMPNGGTATMQMAAPMPTVDDWALLSDGSIALLRGQDYHIDWIMADGSRKSTDRIPYEWKRLTDDEKIGIVDSITKAIAARQQAGGGQAAGGPVMMFGDAVSMGGGAGGARMATREMVMMGGMVAGAAPAAAAPAAAAPAQASTAPASSSTKPGDAKADPKASGTSNSAGSNGNAPASANSNAPASANAAGAASSAATAASPFLAGPPAPAASDLPDYMPAFQTGSTRADADAHIWVRTSNAAQVRGSIIYDVIDKNGALIDRVEVPTSMTIVGFGTGGIVYLTQRDVTGLKLVKATVK